MRLTLNISPCPNDTFMFDAMLHGRVDTEGLTFDLRLADIEALNEAALKGEADVTKVSCAVLPLLLSRYRLSSSGSALGRGNGPLLVSGGPLPHGAAGLRIAVPGLHTTANLLMERLYPEVTDKPARLFSEIAGAVQRGECNAGVLIHEGRFTYHEVGLHLVADLGREWERKTGLPLPLGTVAISKRLSKPTRKKVERVIRRSVEYALAHPDASSAFVHANAQEMDPDVIRKHIALFVNDFSIDLGDEGKRAMHELLNLDETIFV